MSTLLDLTAEIVKAHAGTTQMKSEELLQELQKVHALLQALEGGAAPSVEEAKPTLTLKQAFRKDEVICMVCGKGGMKTLTRHLKIAHDLKPGQYRKQFGIPRSQSLTAKSFSEARKKSAIERGLGDKLAKAREVRAANLKSKNTATVQKSASAKKAAPVTRIEAVKPSKSMGAKKAK